MYQILDAYLSLVPLLIIGIALVALGSCLLYAINRLLLWSLRKYRLWIDGGWHGLNGS